MRKRISRAKLLFALIPIISMAFYILTANDNTYADQSFVSFDIYQQISETMEAEEGKTPLDYSAAENYAIAANIYLNSKNVESTTNGTVTAMGFYKQTVKNYRAKYGEHIFNESVSLSAIVSLAEQRYFKDGAILYRPGSANSSTVKSWSENIVELSPAVYRQRYGVVPREMTKYSVTAETVLSGSFVSDNGDGTYTYELILDPEGAYKYARYEMMTYAGVTSYPDYYSCRLVFTLDSNFIMKEVVSYDTYKIALMGGTECKSKMSEVYNFNIEGMPDKSQIFQDYVPKGDYGGISAEKGPADYLNEGFGDYISGSKVLKLKATAEVLGEELNIDGIVDIAAADYRFNINDSLFVAYKNDKVYIASSGKKYVLGLNDLTALGINAGNISFGADILDTLFAEYSVTETDTHIHIALPFELFGIGFNVDMGLKKVDEGVTADTIDATVKYNMITVPVAVKVTDSVNLPQFNESEYISLTPLVNAVGGTLNMPAYEVNGNVTVNAGGTKINAGLNARIVKSENGAAVEGSISALGLNVPVYYKDGCMYVSVAGKHFKADKSDIEAIKHELETSGALTDIGSKDILDIISTANEIMPKFLPGGLKVQTLLNLMGCISYGGGKLTVAVDPPAGEPWSIYLTHTNTIKTAGINLSAGGISVNASFELSSASAEEITVPQNDYIPLANYSRFVSLLASKNLPAAIDFISAAANTANAQTYLVTVNGSVQKGAKALPVYAQINVKPNGEQTQLYGTVSAASAHANIAFTDKTVYVCVGGADFKLNIDGYKLSIDSLPEYFDKASELITKLSVLTGEENAEALNSALTAIRPAVTAIAEGKKPDTSGIDTIGLLRKLGFALPELTQDGIYELISGLEISNRQISASITPADGTPYVITVQNNGNNLNGVSLNGLSYKGYTLNVNAELSINAPFNINVNEDSLDLGVLNLEKLAGFIEPLVNVATASLYEVNIPNATVSYNKGGVTYSETFSANVAIKARPELMLNGTVTVSGATLYFAFENGTVYAQIGAIAVKLDAKGAQELLGETDTLLDGLTGLITTLENAGTLPEATAQKLIAAIGSVSDIITPLSTSASADSIVSMVKAYLPSVDGKDVSQALQNLEITDNSISYSDKNGGVTATLLKDSSYITQISVNKQTGTQFNVTANLTYNQNANFFPLNEKQKSLYYDISQIKELIAPVSDLLKGDLFELEISSGKINVASVSANISGVVRLNLKKFGLQADLNLNLGEEYGNHRLVLAYKEETNSLGKPEYVVYIGIGVSDDANLTGGIKLRFTIADVKNLIAKINELTNAGTITEESATVTETAVVVAAETVSVIQNALGGKTLEQILQYVTVFGNGEDSNEGFHLGGLFEGVTVNAVLTAKQRENSLPTLLNVEITDFSYQSTIGGNLEFTLNRVAEINDIINADNRETFVKLSDLSDYIEPVTDTIKKQQNYYLKFNGTVVDTHGQITYIHGIKTAENAAHLTSTNGELRIERTNGFANIYAGFGLSGKTDLPSIELYLIDGTNYEDGDKFDKTNLTAYINYNDFRAKISAGAALRILGAACDILDINIPVLDKVLKDVYTDELDTEVFKTMSIVGLDGIRDRINSIFSAADDVTDIADTANDKNGALKMASMLSAKVVDKVLSGVSIGYSVTNGQSLLTINVNNAIFGESGTAGIDIGHRQYKLTPEEDSPTIDCLSYVNIQNLKARGDTVNFKADILYEAGIRLTGNVPQAFASATVYDFSTTDELLISLIRTASKREFDISGTLSLNIMSLIKPNVGISAKVKILEDGSTVAAIRLDVPRVAVLGIEVLAKSESYIYYANDMLYFVVDPYTYDYQLWPPKFVYNNATTEYKSATVSEFLSNPIDYLFFLLKLQNIGSINVKESIMNAMSGGGSGKPSTDLNKIIKEFSYTLNNNNTGLLNVKLDLAKLAGNSDLSDLTFNMGTSGGYINSLSLSTKFVSVIKMELSGTTLKNFNFNAAHELTSVTPIGALEFTKSNKNPFYAYNGNYTMDTLEDALSKIFPVEAAETIADKTNAKTEKVNDSVAAINKAKAKLESLDGSSLKAALINAENDFKQAELEMDKFKNVSEDSLAKLWAEAQYERTQVALQKAAEDYVKAREALIKTTNAATYNVNVYDDGGNKIETRFGNLGYALKAIDAASDSLNKESTARAYAAASAAAEAAVNALNSVKELHNTATNALNGIASVYAPVNYENGKQITLTDYVTVNLVKEQELNSMLNKTRATLSYIQADYNDCKEDVIQTADTVATSALSGSITIADSARKTLTANLGSTDYNNLNKYVKAAAEAFNAVIKSNNAANIVTATLTGDKTAVNANYQPATECIARTAHQAAIGAQKVATGLMNSASGRISGYTSGSGTAEDILAALKASVEEAQTAITTADEAKRLAKTAQEYFVLAGNVDLDTDSEKFTYSAEAMAAALNTPDSLKEQIAQVALNSVTAAKQAIDKYTAEFPAYPSSPTLTDVDGISASLANMLAVTKYASTAVRFNETESNLSALNNVYYAAAITASKEFGIYAKASVGIAASVQSNKNISDYQSAVNKSNINKASNVVTAAGYLSSAADELSKAAQSFIQLTNSAYMLIIKADNCTDTNITQSIADNLKTAFEPNDNAATIYDASQTLIEVAATLTEHAYIQSNPKNIVSLAAACSSDAKYLFGSQISGKTVEQAQESAEQAKSDVISAAEAADTLHEVIENVNDIYLLLQQ